MATRKSNPQAATDYITAPLESRVRQLERRSKRNDLTRTWETSLTYRLVVSLGIYFATATVLAALLIPGWVFTALIPVGCYWMTLLLLSLTRTMWDARTPDNRKA